MGWSPCDYLLGQHAWLCQGPLMVHGPHKHHRQSGQRGEGGKGEEEEESICILHADKHAQAALYLIRYARAGGCARVTVPETVVIGHRLG